MAITQLKTKMTKLLKANGFVKAEVKKEWGHPKFKHAGFEYNDIIVTNVITYHIPIGVFEENERELRTKEKINEIYQCLDNNGFQNNIKRDGNFAIQIFENDR